MGDRDALIYIYEMTQLHSSGWLVETNWDTERRVSVWHGVTVDEGAHVKNLVLGSNRLSGELLETDRFKGFVNLETIYLDSNSIHGKIPATLSLASSLREVNLAWNKFSWPIPDQIWTLVNLSVLRLDNNELEGSISADLGNLKKLKLLNLCNNKLAGPVPKVGNKLVELRTCELLPGNHFEGDVPTTAAEMKEHRETVGSDSRRATLRSRESSAGSSRSSSRAGSRRGSRRNTQL